MLMGLGGENPSLAKKEGKELDIGLLEGTSFTNQILMGLC